VAKARDDFNFLFRPRGPRQEEAAELWRRCRILFLFGSPGSGKTHISLGLALESLLGGRKSKTKPKLMLCRPTVSIGEEVGILPGGLEEKLGPWLAPFRDVLRNLAFDDWTKLEAALEVEAVSAGMLQGRNISDAVMICDEAQSLNELQVYLLLTRISNGGRLIICGDPGQTTRDRKPKRKPPIIAAAEKIGGLDAVAVVEFTSADVVRDPLVADILHALDGD